MRQYQVPTTPDSIWQNPLHFIAFGFGSGALPIAPGTFGTLMAIPFYLALAPLSTPFYITIVFMCTLAAIWLCGRVSREIAVDDHQGMCLDEIIGFLVTMTGAPHHIGYLFAGFLLFRLFDIVKPWPIGWLDTHLHGGTGMILDDVLAGIYSLCILQLAARLFS